MSDGLAIVRSLGALLTILGLLAGALWAVRRFNLVLPGIGLAATDRRLAIVERLSLDPRRSLALLRRDGVEHLVLLAPEGHLVIESRIAAAAVVALAPAPRRPVSVAEVIVPSAASTLLTRIGGDFAALVDRARQPLQVRKRAPAPARRAAANRRKHRA